MEKEKVLEEQLDGNPRVCNVGHVLVQVQEDEIAVAAWCCCQLRDAVKVDGVRHDQAQLVAIEVHAVWRDEYPPVSGHPGFLALGAGAGPGRVEHQYRFVVHWRRREEQPKLCILRPELGGVVLRKPLQGSRLTGSEIRHGAIDADCLPVQGSRQLLHWGPRHSGGHKWVAHVRFGSVRR